MSRTFYQAMTDLPRHIEEKLLTFNVLQLCALVSEKPGTKWAGASDVYGPIQEIARRWDLGELTRRIEGMTPDHPLQTYARVMSALNGKQVVEDMNKAPDKKGNLGLPPKPPKTLDQVASGLAVCSNLQDLQRVAGDAGLIDLDWVKIDGLKNFGLKRMYVGNKWRTFIRHQLNSKDKS